MTDRPLRPEPLEFRAEGVPEQLTDRDQWICWRYEWDSDRDEWTKVPVDGNTGGYAQSTNSKTWTTFEEALAYHESDADTDGLGFVFDSNGLVVGLDYDDCRDPDTGELESWAEDCIESVDSFTEVSPSGTGAHQYALGFLPDGGNRADVPESEEGHIEIYDTGRFFTVTGHRIDGIPEGVEQANDAIRKIHTEYIADDEPDGVSGQPTASPSPVDDLDDAELLEKAKNAENGDKFRRLWNGDTSGYPSHSEADMALCNLLAFWTGGDRHRIDHLFQKSGLYREKWDRDDYSGATIDKALRQVSDYYEPGTGRPSPQPATDGGAAAADTTGAGVPEPEFSASAVLSQARVSKGLPDDATLEDLSDRLKAACVWRLIRASDDVHIRVRLDDDSLWAYEDGIWTRTGMRELRATASLCLGDEFGKNVVTELEQNALADRGVWLTADDFGLPAGKIATENGLVDLDAAAAGDDGAVRELQPDDYALARLPAEFDTDADYSEWQALVEEWAEDGMADALQEFVGYCLHINDMPIHRVLLLVGTGANGKGTFLHTVRRLLGRGNTTSIELQELANEKDATAELYGSVANIDDDLSSRKLGNGLGMFKKLAAGDRVRARYLYQDGFEFDAVTKQLYAANQVPDISKQVGDDDEAFWRRWLLVEFPNHYPPDERDPGLKHHLTEPEALSGVLKWAIEGRRRLLEQGHFTNERTDADEKRERWQSWGDSTDAFVSKHVREDPDAPNRATGDVYEIYTAWCNETGRETVGQRKFTNAVKKEGVGYNSSVRVDGKITRGYSKLGLTDDVAALAIDPTDTANTGLDSFDDGDGGDDLEGEPLDGPITEFVDENQGDDGVTRAEIVDHLTRRGAAEKTADHWLRKLTKRGDIIHDEESDTFTR